MQSKNRCQQLLGNYRRKLAICAICVLLLTVSYTSMLSNNTNNNIKTILAKLQESVGQNSTNVASRNYVVLNTKAQIHADKTKASLAIAIKQSVKFSRTNSDIFSSGLNTTESGMATDNYMYRDGTSVGDEQSKEINLTQRSNSGHPVFGWLSTVYTTDYQTGTFPEDLMKLKPFHFLRTYRNPCWYGDAVNVSHSGSDVMSTERSSMRIAHKVFCLPYYYLIGAPKCGTTDLFIKMVQHPEISRMVPKEPHWITRRRFIPGKKMQNISNYFRIFAMATIQIVQNKLKNGYHSVVYGDHSASTLWDNEFWTILPEFANLTEPPITTADYIHHLNPNTKIIAILRNPIDRLYSDYLYFTRDDKGPESFHKGVSLVLSNLEACLASNSLRHCLYRPPTTEVEVHIRVRIGVYHQYLKEYFRVFPASQILVLKMEEYSKNPVECLSKIFNFLELTPLPPEKLYNIARSKEPANSRGKSDSTIGPMLPETRRLLQNFYGPHNEQLGELLGKEFNYNLDELS